MEHLQPRLVVQQALILPTWQISLTLASIQTWITETTQQATLAATAKLRVLVHMARREEHRLRQGTEHLQARAVLTMAVLIMAEPPPPPPVLLVLILPTWLINLTPVLIQTRIIATTQRVTSAVVGRLRARMVELEERQLRQDMEQPQALRVPTVQLDLTLPIWPTKPTLVSIPIWITETILPARLAVMDRPKALTAAPG